MPNAAPPGKKWVFRPYITKKDGTRLFASQFGKRAFPILVDDE